MFATHVLQYTCATVHVCYSTRVLCYNVLFIFQVYVYCAHTTCLLHMYYSVLCYNVCYSTRVLCYNVCYSTRVRNATTCATVHVCCLHVCYSTRVLQYTCATVHVCYSTRVLQYTCSCFLNVIYFPSFM